MKREVQVLVDSVASPEDPALEAQARRRLDSLTKPPGSLGRLEDLAVWYCLARGEPLPEIPRKRLFVFCADHGVAGEGVSAYPPAVTRQMTMNFAAGGAAVNVLARHGGIEATVVDVGILDGAPIEGVLDRKIAPGTANLAVEPAMAREQAEAALLVGAESAVEAAAQGATLLIGGEMGIGNTTPAAAVASALLGRPGADTAGRGTGVDDEGVARKALVIDRAVARAGSRPDDPVGVLAELGGFEIGALAGLMIGGASRRVPTLVDGFIATAAALVAVRIAPDVRGYLEFAHRSAEQGHRLLLEALGAQPLLDLGMRLGEGSGAALAAAIVDRSVALYREMATFESAGVSSV